MKHHTWFASRSLRRYSILLILDSPTPSRAVPDMEAVMKCYLYEGDIRPFQHMIFGSQRHDFDYHYIGFDEKFLRESLLEAGFKSAERYDWRGTEHFFVDDFSQAYWPSFDCTSRRKEGVIKGKLISLNMEAVK